MSGPDFDDFDDSTQVINTAELAQSGAAQVSSRHVFVQITGSDIGKVASLEGQQFSIGRRADADLSLAYDGVSRSHARVVYIDGNYVLEDLNSSNGTSIAGCKISRHVLRDGDVIQFGPLVSMRYSVTDAKEEKMLKHLYNASVRDALTGAYKRGYLTDRLSTEVAFAARHESPHSLILFDLDHFKNVNDTYGHLAGDAVLIAVAKNVMADLRAEDVFARYGGEEFVVSLRGVDLQGAKILAERIRARNDFNYNYEGREIKVSISVGISEVAELQEVSMENLIRVADEKLYKAKHAGRNCVIA